MGAPVGRVERWPLPSFLAGGAARRPNNQFDLYKESRDLYFSTSTASSYEACSFPRSQDASGSFWRSLSAPRVAVDPKEQGAGASWRMFFGAAHVAFAGSVSLCAFPSLRSWGPWEARRGWKDPCLDVFSSSYAAVQAGAVLALYLPGN